MLKVLKLQLNKSLRIPLLVCIVVLVIQYFIVPVSLCGIGSLLLCDIWERSRSAKERIGHHIVG